MLSRKLAALRELADTLPKDAQRNRVQMPFLSQLQETVTETVRSAAEDALTAPDGKQAVVRIRVSDL